MINEALSRRSPARVAAARWPIGTRILASDAGRCWRARPRGYAGGVQEAAGSPCPCQSRGDRDWAESRVLSRIGAQVGLALQPCRATAFLVKSAVSGEGMSRLVWLQRRRPCTNGLREIGNGQTPK
eukprot:scaffold1862_cov576-Prasinococcus_capsulatus_cf.AAC.12